MDAIKGVVMHPLSVLASLTTSVVCSACNLSISVLFICASENQTKDIKLTMENSVQGEEKRPKRDFSLSLPK